MFVSVPFKGGVMAGGFSGVSGETGTDPFVPHVMDFFSSEVNNSMFKVKDGSEALSLNL